MTLPILIGTFGSATATATRFANLAVSAAAEHGRGTLVVHLGLRTGAVYLCPFDHPIAPATFARGVRFDTDPDVLADDLREEARAAGLIDARDGKQVRRGARRVA